MSMPVARLTALAMALAFVLVAAPSRGAGSDDNVCLPKADFQRFLDIAVERQCLAATKPSFEMSSIVVMTDAEGRVFYTGSDPKKPFALKMTWCHYEVEATGKVDLLAAMAVPPTSGIRFRPKAYLGYLPLKLSKGKFNDGIDAGMMIDWLFIDWVNLNVAAGFRSVGLVVGADLSSNFGVFGGYALGWTAPLHNITGGISFAF